MLYPIIPKPLDEGIWRTTTPHGYIFRTSTETGCEEFNRSQGAKTIHPSVRPSVRPSLSLSLSGEWISIEWLVLTHSISPQLDQGDSLLSVNRKSGTSLGGVDSAEFSSARSTGEPGHWRGRSVAFMAHNGKASLGLHRWYFSYYRY